MFMVVTGDGREACKASLHINRYMDLLDLENKLANWHFSVQECRGEVLKLVIIVHLLFFFNKLDL